MWKIKDPELKAKVNQFFTDEEIHEEFEKNTDLYNYFRLSTVNKKGLCVTITVEKELVEFVPEYQENEWNPYPQIVPPVENNSADSCWLVQDIKGRMRSMRFIHLLGKFEGWSKPKEEFEVVAFRRLPDPYPFRNLKQWGKKDE